ncbi:hypothetical protein [Lichenicoccus roseus]|uniref:Uncharacterized protein n=1 Tax=Lichenicoccus roseus TaxID=2683649 RepID=A0A5R9JC67_9PROT|nr:hypothetical protein [Lichenicoccus roseus]TLU72976.1 hypothetical protein FE263_05870 [Lichenicoccus roseus]
MPLRISIAQNLIDSATIIQASSSRLKDWECNDDHCHLGPGFGTYSVTYDLSGSPIEVDSIVAVSEAGTYTEAATYVGGSLGFGTNDGTGTSGNETSASTDIAFTNSGGADSAPTLGIDTPAMTPTVGSTGPAQTVDAGLTLTGDAALTSSAAAGPRRSRAVPATIPSGAAPER